MKKALIIIDCLRYDYRHFFHYSSLQPLNSVVSVANWTLPSVTTMITGLHPLEHRVGAEPVKGNIVNALQKGSRQVEYDSSTLLDEEGALALVEIPMLALLKPSLPVHRARRFYEQIVWNHLDRPMLLLHFKGGHSKFRYSEAESERKAYEEELETLSAEIKPLVKEILHRFDRVLLTADHGRLFEDYTRNHGAEYGLGVLHVPLFYKLNQSVADELYDSRVIYQLLVGEEPTPRQIVVSTSPAHLEHNRIALTYLHDGKLRSDTIMTSEDWDL